MKSFWLRTSSTGYGMRELIRLTGAMLAWMVLAGPLSAQQAKAPEPVFVASYRDWNLFTYADGNGRVCYIVSEPVEKDGNYTRRGPAALMVARFPMDPPNVQISVQSGYPFKANSDVEVKIDNEAFSLFPHGEHAYARNAAEDERLIEAMKRGMRMTVRGTSQRDTWSLDIYSLVGFTAAYKAMMDACSKP